MPAQAQLVGSDTAPGDSCSGFPAGAARVSADADQNGKDITLICDGSIWQAAGGGGEGIWSDSGSGYIEYSSALGGVLLGAVTGQPAPDLVSTVNLNDLGDVNASTPTGGDVLTWDGSSWVSGAGAAGDFAGLTDTPGNYTGAANRLVAVNAGETALEFIDAPDTNPAGSTGHIQFNNANVFGSSVDLFWDTVNSRLGVGTNTPSTRLEVNGTVTATAFVGDGSGLTGISSGSPGGADTQIQFNSSGSLGGSPDLTWADSRLTVSGRVRINSDTTGQPAPSTVGVGNLNDLSDVSAGSPGSGDVLTWNGSSWIAGAGADTNPAGSTGHVQFNNANVFGSSANLFWDIANNRLGIGTAAPGAELHVVGDIHFTGNIVDVSDIRMKTNIRPLQNPLQKLAGLQGFAFEMKDDPERKTEYGVSAQEVQKVFPELVHNLDDKGMLGVNYDGLIAPMIEAIKVLKTENDQLRDQNDALESRLEALEDMVYQEKDAKR